MSSLKSVITLPNDASVLACFVGEQEILIRIAASVSAVEFVKDFEVSDILLLREAIGITGAEQNSEEMRKAAENFANEMLLPALADSDGCSIKCDASVVLDAPVPSVDTDVAIVHYFYVITNLGRISGRLELPKAQRQGELIEALATETNRLKNDIDRMKADMRELEGSNSAVPLSPLSSTHTPNSRPPPKRKHHMSVVNPNRRLTSARKRTKGLEFSEDDDDDD